MNSIKASTLRPGYLVSLKTSVTGNVQYVRRDIETEHVVEGKQKAKWETERTVFDAAEHEAAEKARGKVNSLIRSVCAKSAFGLLCPENASNELDEAIVEARKVADDFNDVARLTRISVYVIAGKIAQDDVEATKAISSEISDLLETMQNGLQNLDATAVREAANKARSVSLMLSPEMEARVKVAIDTARSSARQIVKAGEAAAVEIDKRAIRKIAEQRVAFLDIGEVVEVEAPRASARAVELEAN